MYSENLTLKGYTEVTRVRDNLMNLCKWMNEHDSGSILKIQTLLLSYSRWVVFGEPWLSWRNTEHKRRKMSFEIKFPFFFGGIHIYYLWNNPWALIIRPEDRHIFLESTTNLFLISTYLTLKKEKYPGMDIFTNYTLHMNILNSSSAAIRISWTLPRHLSCISLD